MKLRILIFSIITLMLTNCKKENDSFDLNKIQTLLDEGETPLTLYDGGVPLDSIYGKIYKEGIIFYFDPINESGLLVSLNDLSVEANWGCIGDDVDGVNNVNTFPSTIQGEETEDGALIGDGSTNTNEILEACNESNIAASICKDLGPEWFLPSRGEFRLMSINLFPKRIEGFSLENMYWTSTETDKDTAWRISLDFGGTSVLKDQKSHVRAIREF